jgi:hypothetical protein
MQTDARCVCPRSAWRPFSQRRPRSCEELPRSTSSARARSRSRRSRRAQRPRPGRAARRRCEHDRGRAAAVRRERLEGAGPRRRSPRLRSVRRRRSSPSRSANAGVPLRRIRRRRGRRPRPGGVEGVSRAAETNLVVGSNRGRAETLTASCRTPGGLGLWPLLPSSELAVAGDAICTIRVDEIAARTAADRVADAVPGAHDVAAGPRE